MFAFGKDAGAADGVMASDAVVLRG